MQERHNSITGVTYFLRYPVDMNLFITVPLVVRVLDELGHQQVQCAPQKVPLVNSELE